jgi:hypothetical protein
MTGSFGSAFEARMGSDPNLFTKWVWFWLWNEHLTLVKRMLWGRALATQVAHAYTPVYSGVRDQEYWGLKPAQAKSVRPYLKKKSITKKGWWSDLRCRPWVQAPGLKKKQLRKQKVNFAGPYSLNYCPPQPSTTCPTFTILTRSGQATESVVWGSPQHGRQLFCLVACRIPPKTEISSGNCSLWIGFPSICL